MAGAGFEPAKAEPANLQSAPFDRFGIPPGRRTLILGSGFHLRLPGNRLPSFHFELAVLRAAERDSRAPVDDRARNEPPASVTGVHEEVVAASGVEELRRSAPALIAAARAEHDLPA